MKLVEFAALKVGDKVENWMSGVSHGTVTEATSNGVKVTWGVSTIEFAYPAHSTAWMHWSRVVEAIEDRPDGIS